jgi:hypothetical protein
MPGIAGERLHLVRPRLAFIHLVAFLDCDDGVLVQRWLCRNVIVAKAAFVAAVEQRAGKRVKLTRGAQVRADSGEKR